MSTKQTLTPEQLKNMVSEMHINNLDMKSLELLQSVINKVQAKRKYENPCTHTKNGGNLNVTYIDGSPLVVCKNCGQKFSMKAQDEGGVKNILMNMTSLAHQSVMLVNGEDKELLRRLHMFTDEARWVGELYNKLMTGGNNKKNKNKKKQNNSFVNGEYGYGHSNVQVRRHGNNNGGNNNNNRQYRDNRGTTNGYFR